MSNVLDYRFFDTENNCYVENKAAFCICQGKVCETLSGHFEEEKSVIAEQSTGLKDKNGKLIYAGDVIKDLAFGEDLAVIEFGNAGGYRCFYPRWIGRYSKKSKYSSGWRQDLVWWCFNDCGVEIVGHIHEKKYDDN